MAKKKRNKKVDGILAIERSHENVLPPKKHASGLRPCLIVDGMNIAHQAYHAYSRLSYRGKSTAIIFGFLQILRPIIQQHSPEKVIICWDGIKHAMRMETLPTYKSHREKNRNKRERRLFDKQVDQLRNLLYRLGIPQAHMEGDDMIYWITKTMQNLYPIKIISGDKDFKQLINWDVNIFNPRTKHIDAVFAFSAEHAGILVTQFVDYLILCGDDSDDIPGYPNIGPVRAGSFLRKHGSIRAYLKSTEDYPGLVDKVALKKLYRRNRLMMNLEWFNKRYTKDIPVTYIRDKKNPNFNEVKYKEICNRFGLRTMVSDVFLAPFKQIGQ